MTSRLIAFGALFGFILSRVGATSYDAIHGMFGLTDLHLMGVIGLAVAVTAVGFALVKRRQLPAARAILPKPMHGGVVWGSALFGIGWAVSGTCPGTALAQLGEGTLAGGITIAGILLGAHLRARLSARSSIAPSV